MGGCPRAQGSKEAGPTFVSEKGKGCEVEEESNSGEARRAGGDDGGAHFQS